ncbi:MULTISPECIES: hypothetical protein [Heyndrickxia]|uniref:Uncharacterized protein n=1 Tax=Heyndrickxia coagulans DSM 1 = ATCC 7050 TaxID=1121088 RepID=A0A0B5WNG0_HEYCO|nr:hypothetical protein [Heyndrickxia coagulans]AJH77450.1 hypothetical protein BF29_2613 [Heyndrickxia coagulans DSM 1 = ATCC 7050]AJH78976.1 hypothetical protein BF29_2536 [Heyndrickxia coagulans DSM 1 = ATCC 7050]AWP37775.1 hypothetical protein CYJ15_12675 [Heyndrickxia coagulans]MCR2847678.1 hypothetical protein [Heyndrickxia coagulans]MDR4225298.1 hypothetical protein [Heyndrickxia coagulans DSM 1 = ATCC 7050]
MSTVKVRKENRVLHVPEGQVAKFLNQGYDQIDETGNIVKRATGGRMVTLQEYNRLLDRVAELEQELSAPKGAKQKKSE